MTNSSFSTPPRAIYGPGRVRSRNGAFSGYSNSPSKSEKNSKVSEMVNPDGSVTIRRHVSNPDGTYGVVQEEYSSMGRRILGEYDSLEFEGAQSDKRPALDCTLSTINSDSSIVSSLKETPVRKKDNGSDHSADGSTFSVHWNKALVEYETQDFYSKGTPAFSTEKSVTSNASSENNTSEIPQFYSIQDTSTMIQGNHGMDDASFWSLLNNENAATQRQKGFDRMQSGRPPLPPSTESMYKGNNLEFGRREGSYNVDSPPMINRCSDIESSLDGSMSQESKGEHLVILQQTTSLSKPKPQIRYYADPTISSLDGSTTKARDLRAQGALFDLQSQHTNDNNLSGDMSSVATNEELTYTVRKSYSSEKVGIFVGVRDLFCGPRLVVSQINPKGKLAESPIDIGDIVVSINGVDFIQNPISQTALDIVRNSKEDITFVVVKNKEVVDFDAFDDFSISSVPHSKLEQHLTTDGGRVVVREFKNNDGSQTAVQEFYDSSGEKTQQTSYRRDISSRGVTKDISYSSLTSIGDLKIIVKKKGVHQPIGLQIEKTRTHRGKPALVVTQVFPSGLFARTPISVGDRIISINNERFDKEPDAGRAAHVILQSNCDVAIHAIKSLEWKEKRRFRLSQARHLTETFTLDAPKTKAYSYDDSSYDSSIFGYNSARKLSLKINSPSEVIGLSVVREYTRFGLVMKVSHMVPTCRLRSLGLQEGDIIVSMNGVDFKDDPDAEKAMRLLDNIETSLDIEYQRLDDLEQVEKDRIPEKTIQEFRMDGTKCTRTETRNPDGSISVQIEEVGPTNPIDVSVGNSSAQVPIRKRIQGRPFDFAATIDENDGLAPFKVLIKKEKKSQNVGIKFIVLGGKLRVTKISKTGLMFGKSILPGDTILEINSIDFQKDPSIRQASQVISQARESIVFKVARNSGPCLNNKKADNSIRKGLIDRLSCGKEVNGSTKAI